LRTYERGPLFKELQIAVHLHENDKSPGDAVSVGDVNRPGGRPPNVEDTPKPAAATMNYTIGNLAPQIFHQKTRKSSISMENFQELSQK
jgi:hypothetical protein